MSQERRSSAGAFRALTLALRWHDWALSKIPMLCTVGGYLCLAHARSDVSQMPRFLCFTFLFAALSSACGFLVNDYGDREIDRRQAKPNAYNTLAPAASALLSALVVLGMLGAGLPFLSPAFVALWALWLLATVAYSLPPPRLKERGWLGLLASVASQCLLPILLAFVALGGGSWSGCGALLGAYAGSAATLEIAHQRHDRARDAATGTRTLAVRLGQAATDRLYGRLLWLDRAGVGVVVAAAILASLGGPAPRPALLAGLAVAGVYLGALAWSVANLEGRADPYYGARAPAARLLHDVIPNLLVPAYLLACLAWSSPPWSLALALFVGWRVLVPRVAGKRSA